MNVKTKPPIRKWDDFNFTELHYRFEDIWRNLNSLIDHTTLTNVGTNTHAQIDTHIAATTSAHGGVLPSSAFSGLAVITVGTSAPGSPSTGDLWVDTT